MVSQQPVREAPASSPFGPKATTDNTATPTEPLLRVDNIQGNILSGFNKDYQTLLFLEIVEPQAFKRWLATLVPFIATASEVLAFNRLFKAAKKRRGREGTVKSTWVNIAFSFEGLKQLIGDKVNGFEDKVNPLTVKPDNAFKQGMTSRAKLLNDPVEQDGNPAGWVVGGSHNDKVHVIVIVASDERADMLAEVARIEESLFLFEDAQGNLFNFSGARITFKEEGANLPPPLIGHEHFGNLDGISQPGIRGSVSNIPGDFLTPRQNPDNPNQGKPGQDLLWPGEFVFGYEGQDPNAKNLDDSKGEIKTAGSNFDWANDGSFLVFRRLRQDVHGFHSFLKETGVQLKVDPNKASAKLIGRWRNGAPTVRAPEADVPGMGDDDCANNDFEFNASADAPGGTKHGEDICQDNFPNAPHNDAIAPGKEATGLLCPFIAHTRKTYPRNDKTPGGGTDPNTVIDRSEVTTQTHRLLRRGIPYGPVSPSTPDSPQADPKFVDRGLHFLAYQTSIEGQFEFITRAWANNPNFSKEAATGHECNGALPLGHDPIIGQSNGTNGDRTRQFFMQFEDNQHQPQCKQLTTSRDWVITTGGGYFFAPSISALQKLT